MNWKLVLQLSLFGLAMAVLTVFVVPSAVEPWLWLAIVVVTAYLVATRASGRWFLHGVWVGIANSVWVTAAHVLLADTYLANHPQAAQMMTTMPMPDFPRVMMVLTGPAIGVLSGVVIGLLAVIARKLVPARTPPTVPQR